MDKGTYGLHMIPNQDSWTVIFSKTNTAWGSYGYDQKEDALRVDVKPRSLVENEEALEFEFENLKPDSTAVTLKWEKLGVPFNVSIKDSEQTLADIRAQLKGRGQFTWDALDAAAQFCLSKKINLDEALRWADGSIQNEERFDNLSTKADILKALNRPDEAKTVWSQALAKADAPQLYSVQAGARKIRSTALKLWKSLKRWQNVSRTESSDISPRPASNLHPAISRARSVMPSKRKLPLLVMRRSRASRA